MGGKATIAAGLVAGVIVGTALAGALVVAGPAPAPGTETRTAPASTVIPNSSPSGSVRSPSGSLPASSGSAAAASGSQPTGNAAFHVGQEAPALRVPQAGGGDIDLFALRGKPVWVNFMASWCPPCRDELPLMSGFAARYGDRDLVVLAIDVKEDVGTIVPFAESVHASLPIGLDDGTAQAAWQAYALPVHFWIDRDGIVRHGALGGIGPDEMVKGIQSILPEVDVKP